MSDLETFFLVLWALAMSFLLGMLFENRLTQRDIQEQLDQLSRGE